MNNVSEFIKLANDNEGFISVIIFTMTLLLGWGSGIFESLRRRPRFKIRVLEGPTFCCSFPTGREYKGNKTHITGLALYLDVTNVGSAPSSIGRIEIGYHNYTFKNPFLWFWLKHQVVSLTDFHVQLGEFVKVYPFLTQHNQLSPHKSGRYLEVGRSTNGVVYFEQTESWGGFRPREKNGGIRIIIRVEDAFGGKRSLKTFVSRVSLQEAQKYNPYFGESRETAKLANTSEDYDVI